MKILTTFSGKFGDILWSLATVRAIADEESLRTLEMNSLTNGIKVDFGIMPQYESLLPLLNSQAYIDKAFVIKEWQCTGSPWGDQPWQSPDFVGREQYDKVIDLTYRCHPRPNSLPVFTAAQQGLTLDGQSFIDTPMFIAPLDVPKIAYAFNPSYPDLKAAFLEYIKKQIPEADFLDVSKMDWLNAAVVIKHSRCFIGCRSANYVIAHGVGQKVICYEPESWRRETTYSYPYGIEKLVSLENAANEAIDQLRQWEIIK